MVHLHVTGAGWDLEGRAGTVREAVRAATGLTEAQFTGLLRRLHTLRAAVDATRPAG